MRTRITTGYASHETPLAAGVDSVRLFTKDGSEIKLTFMDDGGIELHGVKGPGGDAFTASLAVMPQYSNGVFVYCVDPFDPLDREPSRCVREDGS